MLEGPPREDVRSVSFFSLIDLPFFPELPPPPESLLEALEEKPPPPREPLSAEFVGTDVVPPSLVPRPDDEDELDVPLSEDELPPLLLDFEDELADEFELAELELDVP